MSPQRRQTEPGLTTRRDIYKAETRRALLSSAESLFVANGFTATSVGAITEAVLVSKGTFYNHFNDKTAIFAEIYQGQIEQLASSAREACHTIDALPETSALSVAAEFITRALRQSAADTAYREIVAAAPIVLEDGYHEINKGMVLPPLGQLLLTLRLRQELSPTIQVRAAAQVLLSALFESNRIIKASTNVAFDVESCGQTLAMMLSGLSKSAA